MACLRNVSLIISFFKAPDPSGRNGPHAASMLESKLNRSQFSAAALLLLLNLGPPAPVLQTIAGGLGA